jgi:hypothetical protein
MKIHGVFTPEAEQLLEEQTKEIMSELRKASIEEAFQSRGEPVEVTASDVKRIISNTYLRRKSLKPATDFILRVYMIIGILIFIVAIFYGSFSSLLQNLSDSQILSFSIGIAGIVLAFTSYLMRYYYSLKRVRYKRDVDEVTKIDDDIKN